MLLSLKWYLGWWEAVFFPELRTPAPFPVAPPSLAELVRSLVMGSLSLHSSSLWPCLGWKITALPWNVSFPAQPRSQMKLSKCYFAVIAHSQPQNHYFFDSFSDKVQMTTTPCSGLCPGWCVQQRASQLPFRGFNRYWGQLSFGAFDVAQIPHVLRELPEYHAFLSIVSLQVHAEQQ